MKTTLDLNGKWQLRQADGTGVIPAKVPGDVYSDLLRAKQIPDPFYRDNELALQWIGESGWSYTRTFNATSTMLSRQKVILHCDGLDTFAAILINGKCIAETDNMFRTWEWDIKSALKAGCNTIQIDFKSVLPYIHRQSKSYPAWKGAEHLAAYGGWVRKEQCNFGWDWGIKAITCGIWRSIKIIAFDEGRLADIDVRQRHARARADLDINISMEGCSRRLEAGIAVLDKGKVVAECSTRVIRGRAQASVTVKKPELWWPNRMGDQPLYTIQVELKDSEGRVLDTVTKRIGLRTIELDRHTDQWGESFQLKVNGVSFFAKGANWIPVDAVLGRRRPSDYHRLIKAAADCNMNMLRVWGGGIYEDDCFYDICDELGIFVWQDFMFACSAYPFFQKKFVSGVRQEARDAIKRLRHHPSMALFCGNNELEMMNVGDDGWQRGRIPWNAYKKIFDGLLPAQVSELSPDIPYWPSSPHSPVGDRRKHRDERSGDAHLWIMTANPPFECARGMEHRFVSEFGFQSFPGPKTTLAFTMPSDRNIASRVMEHHQRAPGGNTTIAQQILKCLPMPNSFDSFLWASQIMQGVAVKNACEHFRRNMNRTMGALYWQLNDCWPVASWASIDYNGRWKALQYMIRHAFSPVLVSGVSDVDEGTVDIHLTSDRLVSLPATVSWIVTNMDGTILERSSQKTRTPRMGSRKVTTLRLAHMLKQYGKRNLLVWLSAKAQGEALQRNLVWFAQPKHMDLHAKAGIQAKTKINGDGSFSVTLSSKRVALWTWLTLKKDDAEFSDNFFHLRPGMRRTIKVTPLKKMTLQQLRRSMDIRSLVDTY